MILAKTMVVILAATLSGWFEYLITCTIMDEYDEKKTNNQV